MQILTWNEGLNIGIDVIDAQHRTIADNLNRLARVRHEGGGPEELEQVFEQTADYALFHFGFEEELLEEAGYELLSSHRRAHAVFVDRVRELQDRFRAGENTSEALHALLADWLFNHIRHEDRAYVDTVRAYMAGPRS